MTNKDLMDIVYHVRDKYGLTVAAAVQASLEVAKARWTEEDTTKYGAWISDQILEQD